MRDGGDNVLDYIWFTSLNLFKLVWSYILFNAFEVSATTGPVCDICTFTDEFRNERLLNVSLALSAPSLSEYSTSADSLFLKKILILLTYPQILNILNISSTVTPTGNLVNNTTGDLLILN